MAAFNIHYQGISCPLLGPTESVLCEIKTLSRLVQLHQALPRRGEDEIRQAIEKVGQFFQFGENIAFDEAKLNISAKLHDLEPSDKKIGVYIQRQLRSATTMKDLRDEAANFDLDKHSLAKCPLQKPSQGLMGPTFLADYQTIDRERSLLQTKTGVIKWTDGEGPELVANRIYSEFLQTLAQAGSGEVKLATPSCAMIDLTSATHEMPDRRKFPLGEAKAHFHDSLYIIRDELAPEAESKGDQILLAERVVGENLLDFALNKYASMSVGQKSQFFQGLARLALLDVFVGNTDRLLQIMERGGVYNLEDFEVNLGNAMISIGSDESAPSLTIHAIDNGIDEHLIEKGEHADKYFAFLERTLSKDGFESILADTMIGSLKSAFSMVSETKEMTDQLSAIQKDLSDHGVAHALFVQGFKEMLISMRNEVIPKWEKDSGELKQYISEKNKSLVEVLSRRFSLIQTT